MSEDNIYNSYTGGYNEAYTLSEEYRERVIKGLKNHHIIVRIFGGFLLFMAVAANISFWNSYFTTPEYRQGLFEFLPARIIFLVFANLILLGFLYLAFKLYNVGNKAVKAFKKDDFIWREGVITRAERINDRYHIEVDGIDCELLESDIGEGSPVITIFLYAKSKGKKGSFVYVINT